MGIALREISGQRKKHNSCVKISLGLQLLKIQLLKTTGMVLSAWGTLTLQEQMVDCQNQNANDLDQKIS